MYSLSLIPGKSRVDFKCLQSVTEPYVWVCSPESVFKDMVVTDPLTQCLKSNSIYPLGDSSNDLSCIFFLFLSGPHILRSSPHYFHCGLLYCLLLSPTSIHSRFSTAAPTHTSTYSCSSCTSNYQILIEPWIFSLSRYETWAMVCYHFDLCIHIRWSFGYLNKIFE